MRHWIWLDSNTFHTVLLTLNWGSTGPAERIENNVGRSNVEPVEIILHEVGRKRQHEAIPVVDDPILDTYLVPVGSCSGFI